MDKCHICGTTATLNALELCPGCDGIRRMPERVTALEEEVRHMKNGRQPGVCYCDWEPPSCTGAGCPENPPTRAQVQQLLNQVDELKREKRVMRAAIAQAHEYAIRGAAGFAAGALADFVDPDAAKPDLNADLLELQRLTREAQQEAALERDESARCKDLARSLEDRLRAVLVTLRQSVDDLRRERP